MSVAVNRTLNQIIKTALMIIHKHTLHWQLQVANIIIDRWCILKKKWKIISYINQTLLRNKIHGQPIQAKNNTLIVFQRTYLKIIKIAVGNPVPNPLSDKKVHCIFLCYSKYSKCSFSQTVVKALYWAIDSKVILFRLFPHHLVLRSSPTKLWLRLHQEFRMTGSRQAQLQ